VQVNLDAPDLIAFLLAMARIGAWLAIAPPFSTRGVIPVPAKAALAAGLALPAVPMLAHRPLPTTTPSLIGALGAEILTGLALGFILLVLVSTFATAGSLADLFGGIVLPPSLDPLSDNQVPLIGQLYEQVAIVLLFTTNGELLVVHGLIGSFSATSGFGLGISSAGGLARGVLSDLVTLFVAAIEIAGPVLVVLFMAQVILGLLAKVAPQTNVFILGFPFQVLVTILVVTMSVRALPSSVVHIVERALSDMGGALRAG
jgi:flagellar biosynthetic protein FliR